MAGSVWCLAGGGSVSGKIVGMVFDFYPGRASELLLAVKLADNAHDDGTSIYPSVRLLAELTRQSERNVQYQLKAMTTMGWLVLVRHARGGGRAGDSGRPREYRIHPDWVWQYDMKAPDKGRPTWQRLDPPAQKEIGAEIAPISLDKWVQPEAEMGAIAVAEMGAIAVAPEPSLTVKEPNTPQPPKGGERGFEAIAAKYPKKVDMSKARKRWQAINPDAALELEIELSIKAWAASTEWNRDNGRWIPKFCNWLRGERWKDVPGVAAPLAPPLMPHQPRAAPSPMPDDVRAKINQILGRKTKALAVVDGGEDGAD